MTPSEFAAAIKKIIDDNKLTPAQVMSGLAGALVGLCKTHGEDPTSYIMWATQASREMELEMMVANMGKTLKS